MTLSLYEMSNTEMNDPETQNWVIELKNTAESEEGGNDGKQRTKRGKGRKKGEQKIWNKCGKSPENTK